MKKRRILSLVTAACLAFSLTSCGSTSDDAAADSGDTSEDGGTAVITLGMIGPLTGSLAVYGTHNQRGVELAIEEINAAGGVTRDEFATLLTLLNPFAPHITEELWQRCGFEGQIECVNAMNALISDGIQLVIGSATSGCTSAITSIANSEGVVLITPSGTADSLTTSMGYVFRTCFRDSFQGELAAQYAADQGYTRVGIVYCSADTYSSGLRDAFSAACAEKGIEVVAEESVATMTEVDYTNQFNQMVSAGAELVFTPFYYDVMGPYLIPQARSVGFDGVLLGADGVDNTETTIPDGADLSAYNNVMFVNHYSTDLLFRSPATCPSASSRAMRPNTASLPTTLTPWPMMPCMSWCPPWRTPEPPTPPASRPLWQTPARSTRCPPAPSPSTTPAPPSSPASSWATSTTRPRTPSRRSPLRP